jgi:hypothetical protein
MMQPYIVYPDGHIVHVSLFGFFLLEAIVFIGLFHFTETGVRFERSVVRLLKHIFCYDIDDPEVVESRIW